MHGAITKHLFPKNDVFVVSIVPCTAKKEEAMRPFMKGDVDAVLTTGIWHARFVQSSGGVFWILGESSGTAQLFGATGGVLESALRTACFILGGWKKLEKLDFHEVRGFEKIKECHIEGVGTVAAVNGIAAAQELLSNGDWKTKYKMIEVMACPGGCLGGGGEPKSLDPLVLQKRMKDIYKIDEIAVIRSSHENKDVQKLYSEHLGHPLSHKAEELLHTVYFTRNSDRELLARFLSAINNRDGKAVADLLEDNGAWETNDPNYGRVAGKAAIAHFVDNILPSTGPTHRLYDPATGMAVQVGGKVFNFQITRGKHGLIHSIERLVASNPAADSDAHSGNH